MLNLKYQNLVYHFYINRFQLRKKEIMPGACLIIVNYPTHLLSTTYNEPESVSRDELISLLTVDNQDRYLTGRSDITFWKTVYRRHTNFSVESNPSFFESNRETSFGRNVTFNIHPVGNLISPYYLSVTLPSINL